MSAGDHSFFVASHRLEGHAQAIVGLCQGWLKSNRFVEGGDRFFGSPRRPECIPKIAAGFGERRIEPNCFAAGGQRLFGTPDCLERIAEIAVGFSVLCIDQKRTCDQIDRRFRLTGLDGEGPEQMQRFEVRRLLR